MPYNGTFAEKIVISENFVERKPAHLTWPEAGVFSLSALTGYRALITQGKLKRNETLFIPGVGGGGVTSFIIQMAKVIGARVITTSRQPNKLKEAELLGFDRGLLTDDDWVKELEDEQIDMVIDSIGGATFNRSLEVLKKGGAEWLRLVLRLMMKYRSIYVNFSMVNILYWDQRWAVGKSCMNCWIL
ncbi:zinc-containing alcohol dehydrogenase [Gracilibacillus boraciitolerans JCM 21714]|uniref:Zinc-containing alcohol dehydrogenase n=1 Tax=Gracilibacillus boraciitolerans JCM 21714 TaxID=1298598 RepID=W4VF51_9BACI|nr:zinc-containing alcohol dehydrogenase [Gracilibacillus boraciitolerans JCM 21714]